MKSVLPWILVLSTAIGLVILSSPFLKNGKESLYPELKEIATYPDWTTENFMPYFETLAETKGALYAFDVLLEAELSPQINVHLLGHEVGAVLYKEKGIEAMELCTQDFRNACSHSVVIGIMSDYGEGSLETIADICRQSPGGRGSYTMCFHGLGHGVLAYTRYDLEKAIAMCEKVGTSEYGNGETIECVGGAIMEMDFGIHDPEKWQVQAPKYYSKEDVLAPCTAAFIPGTARPICYTYLTPHLMRRAGFDTGNLKNADYRDAFAFCDLLPRNSHEERDSCFGGFGKEFVGFAKKPDVRDFGSIQTPELVAIRAQCGQAGSAAGTAACNSAALASLYWGGESNPDASFRFCAIAGVAEETCYRELAGLISRYVPDVVGRTALCVRFPETYQALCRGG